VPSRIVDHYTEKSSGGGGGTDGKIPLTPEEKLDTLTYALDLWISGMMDACTSEDGVLQVKAWDVVNEAISGADSDGDGIYDLQHGSADTPNDFFWQDHMGDLEYVRTVVRLARQYGGNDLKLFINDYNLESDWDQNKKLKSLIKWIEKWEADGTTKIDGIGSQMHISCYMNPQTQESKKKAIEESFKLMAESGKLVRISELDMGLVDESGNDVNTADVTEEQHHAMAELYTWIIKKYKEIIPASQQWGICQWCATDSPASSGWRANQPVGLWDQNYYRKHTYAGFADGLAGE
jgi:GH35 family endo-1,4-beta-xylanase